tara:strand:+ start:86 stop:298 length:213 start_codon:yes stop_codon:yes gene_type:complete
VGLILSGVKFNIENQESIVGFSRLKVLSGVGLDKFSRPIRSANKRFYLEKPVDLIRLLKDTALSNQSQSA